MSGRQRKHYRHMTKRERAYIREVLDNIGYLELSGHCFKRNNLKMLTETEVRSAAKFGQVIECHFNKADDVRVVVRYDTRDPISVCAVISLATNRIVTAYPNERDDHHRTIDWTQYLWRGNAEEEIKKFLQQKGRKKYS